MLFFSGLNKFTGSHLSVWLAEITSGSCSDWLECYPVPCSTSWWTNLGSWPYISSLSWCLEQMVWSSFQGKNAPLLGMLKRWPYNTASKYVEEFSLSGGGGTIIQGLNQAGTTVTDNVWGRPFVGDCIDTFFFMDIKPTWAELLHSSIFHLIPAMCKICYQLTVRNCPSDWCTFRHCVSFRVPILFCFDTIPEKWPHRHSFPPHHSGNSGSATEYYITTHLHFQDKTFIGKGAVDGSRECLVQLEVLPSGDKWLWGHEPVYTDGTFSGWTTSAQYDFQKNKILCWAFLNRKIRKTENFEVEVADEKFPAEIR